METMSGFGKVLEHREGADINDAAFHVLRQEFTDAISCEIGTERVVALENLIAKCAAPLEALEGGAELSPEYEQFLTSLLRMHMLESARVQLENALNPST